MNNEKKQEIRDFALDTADKFDYLIKRLKRTAKIKNLEISTLEKVTDEIYAAYNELREYLDKKTGKTYMPNTFANTFERIF